MNRVDNVLTDLMQDNIKKLSQLNSTNLSNKIAKSCGYHDTDIFDIDLYQELGSKYGLPVQKNKLITYVNQQKIRLSADAWVGTKQLACISHDTTEWIKFYKIIQSDLHLRLLWPVHRLPTINTSRYIYFHDRVDLLLTDLQRWFNGQSAVLEKIYTTRETGIWLNSFNSFDEFIDSMYLRWLVKDGRVINIVDLTTFDDNVELEKLGHNHGNDLMRRYILNSIKLVRKNTDINISSK